MNKLQTAVTNTISSGFVIYEMWMYNTHPEISLLAKSSLSKFFNTVISSGILKQQEIQLYNGNKKRLNETAVLSSFQITIYSVLHCEWIYLLILLSLKSNIDSELM